MWVSTSKGKTVQQPSAADLIGALAAAGPGEAVVVARDLMRFIYVARESASAFSVWLRDGSPERQVRLAHTDAQDVASAVVAFATHASFARDMVDAMQASAATSAAA